MTVYNKLAYQRGELLSKQHAPRNVEARLACRFNGEVGRLNKWVEEVRAETSESIPYLDSDTARKGVRILMLFQDPSGAAEGDSGFISKLNNDPTARNYYGATEAAGGPYDITLNWNVVPWWSTDNPLFPARTVSKEAPRAAPYLVDFIRLLSEPPRVLVLSGDKAQKSWDRIASKIDAEVIRNTVILRCPHPSPLSYNATNSGDGRKNYLHIIETFREAARIAG